MPRFEYRARDAVGAAVQGAIDAENREIATETLKDRGLALESLEERKESALFEKELPFFNSIPDKELVIFSRQLAVLMGAKVPVVQAIKTVARQTRHQRLQRIVAEVGNDVETGTSLSMALGRHPKAFSDFFVNMIRSGETTGRLEEVMNYMADQMERDFDLSNKIRGAMIYPVFVIAGLVVVGFVMMTFVVPKLTAVLQESGVDLPWTTRTLIGISGFFQAYWIQILVATVLAGGSFRWWIGTPDGKASWDAWKLRIPVFGPLMQKIYIVRFTRSMSTLLAGGVDIPASIDVCADVVGNEYWKRLLIRTRKEVNDGNSVSMVLAGEKIVPQMIPQMMTVGEETSRLSEVLERLTNFYSRELSNDVANLVSAIEPLIMLVMGLAVGVMVAAIILPMYTLATSM